MKKMKSETNEHVLTLWKRNENSEQRKIIKLVTLWMETKSGETNESVLTLLKRNENSKRLLS